MIKFCLLLSVLVYVSTSKGQSIMLGLGGSYGSQTEQIGVNTRIYYGLNERICFGPEFTYFPAVNHNGESVQLNEYGFVAHYIFEVKEKLGFYPLVGINFSVERNTHLGETHNVNALGASFGGGMHLTINNFSPFIEYKYITGSLSQSTFSLGIIYNFKLKNKEE